MNVCPFCVKNHFDYEDERVIDVVIMEMKKLYNIKWKRKMLSTQQRFLMKMVSVQLELEGEFAELGGWEAESEASRLLQNLNISEVIFIIKLWAS